jgi:hypothetical protein
VTDDSTPEDAERLVVESDALHARVRAFATGSSGETFEALALRIARFQRRYAPGFARLVAVHRSALGSADDIPAVPAEVFRIARVAVHAAELDVASFETSGTTAVRAGVHAFRTLETYRALALALAEKALFGSVRGPCTVVALAPPPGALPRSSLGFMLRLFMDHFDARPPVFERGFDGPERFLCGPSGIDVARLFDVARLARERGEPLCVLATSFALVALLDALGGAPVPAPPATLVMQTGGFKGRAREVDAAELRAAVARTFGIGPESVVGEYGMTELTSQLYEDTGATRPTRAERFRFGVYCAPPWLRVVPVNPATLEPCRDGEVGIAKFIDLGNVDSAVAVITQDLVVRRGDGIELLGRRRGAPPRGCSLAVEGLLTSHA